MSQIFHQPVMKEEAGKYLLSRKDGIYVDCTLGGGGHSRFFLQNISTEAFLVGIDTDQDAISQATSQLSQFPNTHFAHVFYDQIDVVLHEIDRYPVSGVFYDLGVSSYQLDQPQRGFTFRENAPLDMRLNSEEKLTAADVLNHYSQQDLQRIIREYGEERYWRPIVREIMRVRELRPMTRTTDLVEAVSSVVSERFLTKSLARVFQAVRIEVNQELERLAASLQKAFDMLEEGGRLVVISYHSLEDRIVKTFFRAKQNDCICPPQLPQCVCEKVREMSILTRRPLVPSPQEVASNPRARSAKMRAAEKTVPFSWN